MTKYEIAENETDGIFDTHEIDITGLGNAFDIFARQEAIEFDKWKIENGVKYKPKNAPFIYEITQNNKVGVFKDYQTIEGLYQLFQKSKQLEQ